MPKKEDQLTSILKEVNFRLRQQNSLGFNFLQGLTRGLGTALGATVLVAIATSVTIHFADSELLTALTQAVIKSLTN